ncbi:MAG TPA: translocation/assembly module TamB domain-containing protein [Thiolinea sp.]|nr:translocation/assembly module TamB domain-containing protein [Thiolinea sp.]
MRGWLRYLVFRPLLVLALVFLLLLAVLGVLALTQTGTNVLVGQLQVLLPDMALNGVRGTLLQRVEADSLSWEKDGIRLEARDVVFDPEIEARLPILVTLGELSAGSLTIDLPPSTGEPLNPIQLPDIRLPVDVALKNVSIDQVLIRQGTAVFELRDAALSAYAHNGVLYLEQLVADLPENDGRLHVSARGEMGLKKPHPVTVSLDMEGDSSRYGGGKVNLNANGNLLDYPLTGSGHWQFGHYPALELDLMAHGNLERLDLDAVKLSGDAGQLQLTGELAWSPILKWDVRLTGDALRPEYFAPDMTGELALDMASQGQVAYRQPTLALELARLHGTLRDYPVDAGLKLSLENGRLALERLDAAVGDNHVRASGKADESLAVDWEVDAPALAQLHPRLNGRLSGDGTLAGKVDGSEFALKINVLDGQVLDYPVSASGSLNLQDQVLSADALKLQVGDNHLSLNGVADEASGIDWLLDAPGLEQLHASLDGHLKGQGNARGLLDGSRLNLRVDTLAGVVKDYPVEAAGTLRVEDRLLSADDFKVTVGGNRLQLNGVADEASGIDWTLDAPRLDTLHTALDGSLKGKGVARGLLDGSRLALQIDELGGKVRDYPVQAQGEVRLEGQSLSANDLQLDVGDNHVRLNGVADAADGIDWTLDAPRLDQLHASLSGSLKGKGNAQGVLDGSRLALRIDELDGRVRDYPLSAQGAVQLEDKLLSATGLQVDVGGNRLALDGVADEASGIDWTLDAPYLTRLHPSLDGSLKGRGNARGLLDGSRLSLRVDELTGEMQSYPVSAQGELQLRDQVLSASGVSVKVGDNQVQLNGVANAQAGIDWRIDAPALDQLHPSLSGRLKGHGNAKGVLDGSRLSLHVETLEGRIRDYPVQAGGELRLLNQVLSASNMQITVGDNQLVLNGTADEDKGLDWKLKAGDLSQLYPAVVGNLEGNGNARGLLDGSRLTLQVDELQGKVRDYPVSARGKVQVRDRLLSADGLVLALGDNEVRLDGTADEGKGLHWQLDAAKLAQLQPSLSGNLKGRGTARGLLDGSRLTLQVAELDGRVRGYPVSAGGEVRVRDKVLSAEDLALALGDNRIVLNGTADEKTGLDWRIDAPDLSQINPALDGRLKGQGMAKGLLDGSRLALHVESLDGRIKGFPLSARGDVRLRDRVLSAEDLQLALGDNRVVLNGTADEQSGLAWRIDAPELSRISPALDGRLKGQGTAKGLLDGSRLALHVESLDGRIKGFPLSARGDVRLRDRVLSAEDLQLALGDNRVVLDGTADEGQGLAWRLDARQLVQLNPALDGELKGYGTARGLLDGSRLSLQIGELGGRVRNFPVRAEGGVRLQDKVLSADQLVLNVGGNLLRVNGSADESRGLDWTLDAPDLSRLYPALQGNLRGNGNARGLLDGSRLSLRIDALDGRVNSFPVNARGEVQLRNRLVSASDLQLVAGANRLVLDGVADEVSGINWRLDAQQLAQLNPALDGSLQGQGNIRGLLDGSRAALHIDRLTGRVRGFPVRAQGEVRVNNRQLAANNLQLAVGDNRLLVNGVADEAAGLNWSLDAPDLKQLDPRLYGTLKGNGNVRGRLDGSSLVLRIDTLGGRILQYPLSARGQIGLQQQRLSADNLQLASGNNRILLNGVVDESTGLNWSLDAPELKQMDARLDGGLKGSGNVRGKLDGSSVLVRIDSLGGRILQYPLSVKGQLGLQNRQVLSASNLQLALGDNRLVLNGVADETTGLQWSLDAPRLVQLNPALDGSVKGNGSLKGRLDGSHATLAVNRLEGRVRGYPLLASGTVMLDNKMISARNVVVTAGQNQLRVNGSAGSSVGLDWELDARNLAQFSPALQGGLKGNGRLVGTLDGSKLDLQVASLRGQINGRPVDARGTVNLDQGKVSVQDVQLVAGQNVLQVSGQVTEPYNLRWKLDGRNLSQVMPGLAGSLQGEGTLQGALKQPRIQGTLTGRQLRYQDMQLGSLDVKIAQNGSNYDVQGVARQLRQGENQLAQADFTLQGQLERHGLTLRATHKAGQLELQASGGLSNGQWNGAIQQLSLRNTVAGDWQLTAPARLGVSATSVTLANSCLANRQNAQICNQVSWNKGGGLNAKGALQQVPLAMATSFGALPATIQLPGVINASYQFEQRGQQPFAQVSVVLPDSSIIIRGARGTSQTLQYVNAKANITLNGGRATVQAQADVPGYGQIRTDGNILLDLRGGQHRVDLRTIMNVPDLAWVQRYAPQVDGLQGQLAGDVRVTGLLSQPQIVGTVRLQGGSLSLPETGSKLTDINFTAQAANPGQINLSGTLRAGQGEMKANGVLRIGRLPDWSADLRVQGANLLLMNTHEIQAYVSPDLSIKATPQSVAISGTVRIPQTTITLRDLPTGANKLSDDVVIVGRQQPRRQRGGSDVVIVGRQQGQQQGARQGQRQPQGQPIPATVEEDDGLYIQPNVMVELGDRVTFSGFGLEGRLTGRMRIARNRQGIAGEGVLNVLDGNYNAYGQKLKIERGRLLFSGPIDNPGLDVRAVRQIDSNILVGITLGGTVQEPQSTLFSNPPQSQTDTLSYLLTGRALSGVKGSETEILTQAVTGLGLAGGENLAQRLGGELGLDDVGLNAGGGDYRQSQLSLGKRLGPKLYVKYIVGLFDSMQKVAVNYEINKRLHVEVTSGVQQSIDLIYKLDTDRGPFGK